MKIIRYFSAIAALTIFGIALNNAVGRPPETGGAPPNPADRGSVIRAGPAAQQPNVP
jgi:hypothetical protein